MNMKYENLNDHNDTLWTDQDMKDLYEAEKHNGYYVYDDYDEWLDHKLDMDFREVEE